VKRQDLLPLIQQGRKPMKNIIHAVVLLSLLAVICPEVSANPPPAYEGRRLYISYCQLCHGPGGKGGGPLAEVMQISPADLTTTVRSRSDTILTKIITGEGRQTITGRDRHNLLSDAMPEWKGVFTESQIKALIAYLRFLGRAKHDLMGDPEVGMQLYQKYCHVCHGVEGDGDGIMTNLMGIMPMDHTNPNETNSLDNNELMDSILDGQGKYMPAWRGILSQSDVEALVSYIRLLSH
jgi:cbb3-type cytochrome c oxidase subunit III